MHIKMKIRLIATATFLICFYSTASTQVRIGLKAGLNMAQVAFSDDYVNGLEEFYNRELGMKMIPSFHAGVQAEFDFIPQLGMGVGLQMSGKGYRYGFDYRLLNKDYSYSLKSTPLYVQAPVNVYFRSHHFFAAVGGYVGLGMSGKHNTKAKVDDVETTDEFELEFTDKYDPLVEDNPSANYSPLDFGASVELGYEISRIRISASYQFGLANTFSKEYVDVNKMLGFDVQGRHRVIGVSVAYLFGSGIE